MPETFFNLNNPFEKQVSERLDEYLKQGLPHDKVLNMIGRDFPYMDNEVSDHCEDTAFIHHYTGEDGNTAATFKRVALLHGKFIDEPFYSHIGQKFHLKKGEDLYVAVQVENPLYLYDKANVRLTFHVDGKQVNELKHVMAMEERRNVYYVPLNLLENKELSEESCTRIRVDVVDENIKGNVYSIEPDVYYGETDPSEVFTLQRRSVYSNYGCGDEEVFNLKQIETLHLQVSVHYTGHYGPIGNIEGIVTISPSDSADKRNVLVRKVYMSEKSGLSDLDGDEVLCNISGIFSNIESVPYFKPEPGKYTINFFVLDALLCSREIEFIVADDPADEFEQEESESEYQPDSFDELLDDFLKEMEAEVVGMGTSGTAAMQPEPPTDPFEHIEVVGLNLFNIDSGIDYPDRCMDDLMSLPQTSFAADKLKMLSVIGKLKIIGDGRLVRAYNAMKWLIYDHTGRLVDCHPAQGKDVQNEYWVYAAFGDFCRQNWAKGSYRLELQWQDTTVISAVFMVGDIDVNSDYDPKLIIKKPLIVQDNVPGNSLARLEKMAGLKGVKEKVHSLMNFYNLQKMREEAGLPVKRPALHARFLGNPGTGKTTVARLLGQIYKEMGLLSSGHVVLEERKNMIGRYYDSEGQAVENALNRARGGILLIDEAYNLYVENDDKDPGRRILEYLLTALADENNRDWMLILAGYPKEMKTMLESNPGIESRVSETFEFEDLGVDELLQVAELYCDDNKYELSEDARERLKAVMTRDVAAKDKNFGNGRYVNKLMETAINTRMATRLSKVASPTYDQLVTIEADDIPIDAVDAERISSAGFDDKAIDEALRRLDALVGLSKVKSAIHNFVNISRFLNSQGERIRGKGLLKWNFTGNTGTGKSTVAQILADILKGMNLIQNSELTEVKGEEIFNVSDYECNEVIREAVKRSRRGVLFIDGDAPEFRSSQYRMTSEQIRFKLATLASEDNASGALIISECSSPNLSIANSLAANGIYDFDHTFIFDDYTADELYNILVQCLEKLKTRMSEEAEEIIREYIRNLCANRDLSFANARTMKNLSRAIFETVILRMSKSAGPEAERVVLAGDVESFVWRKISGKIGF